MKKKIKISPKIEYLKKKERNTMSDLCSIFYSTNFMCQIIKNNLIFQDFQTFSI